MIKAVLFDLNGVFLESEFLSERFERKYGVSVDDFLDAMKGIMDIVRKPNAPSAYSLWKPYFEKWKLNITEEEFFDFWFSGEKIVDELVEYAKLLKRKGLKVFIVSNNFRERTEFYRNKFIELFNIFDGTYFSWETGYVKPDQQAFINVLNENNLKADECVYFDDSEKNVESAKNVSIFTFKYEGPEETKNIINSLISN